MNKTLACLVLATMTLTATAQSGTNSPYSQYGVGDITDQSVGFNKGMNGVGLAMRRGNEVNPMNPASYSSVDSLSMIFDAGLSGQITNFNENGNRLNAKSGGFDYAVGLLRAFRHVGVSFGVIPYSNIGYKYATLTTLNDIKSTTNVQSTYEGKGGLHQLYIGAAWNFVKPLSVGFNLSYLWGDINRSVSTSSSSAINNLAKEYSTEVSSYKLEFGIQYEQPLSKMDKLTLGATFSPSHKLGADPICRIINKKTVGKSDTTTLKISNGLSLPTTFGLGLAYSHGYNFRAGADFMMQKWGKVDFPAEDGTGYSLQSGLLKDSYRMNAGMEWVPNPMGRSIHERIRYRLGVGYATPYYYINGKEGPKEFSASIGFGIPIMNGYNTRSVLNISGQYVHRSADNLIKENTFRINIGLTFNERWFAKWKVE